MYVGVTYVTKVLATELALVHVLEADENVGVTSVTEDFVTELTLVHVV